MKNTTGRQLFDMLGDLQTLFQKNIEAYFSKWSLTSSQILVLSLLDKHSEMKISEIAANMELPDSNVSGIIDRLEKAGFVERTRSAEDRRVVKVKFTSKAYEVKKEFDLDIEKYFQELLKGTSQDEVNEIAHNLEKLKNLILKFVP